MRRVVSWSVNSWVEVQQVRSRTECSAGAPLRVLGDAAMKTRVFRMVKEAGYG